jgi:hypothetical protein
MRSPLNNTLILSTLLMVLGSATTAVEAAAPATPQGYINFRTYAGDQRAAVRTRTAVPDGSFYPKRAEGPYFGYPGPDVGDDDSGASDVRDNYNMELIGYFYPPRTGKIQFALCTDDPGELWLGTNDDPATKVQIATEPTWNGRRAYGTEARRTRVNDGTLPADRLINHSKFFDVVAGKPYFIQSIATEFGGGDNSSIAFRYDTDPEFADGDKPILGTYLSPFYATATASILSQPVDRYVYAPGNATFSVAVDVGATGTVTSYKWQRNGVDVPNSDSATLTVAATAADDGAKYKAIINTSLGNLTSSEVTLNVATLSNTFSPGALKWEVWRDIGGNAVSALTDDPRYPASPDEVRLLPTAETPINIYEAFGARVSGFVIPATTGNYVFFLSADDNAELYLSTDESPANKKLIARETAWSNTKQWTVSGGSSDLAEKRSDESTSTEWPTGNTITLTAGRKYYMELLYKEGGGGDVGSATMVPAGTTPVEGVSTLAGSLIGVNAAPSKGTPQITKQPVLPAVMQAGLPWTVSVDGVVNPAGFNFPLIVQWQKNGVNIAGANAKTFTIPKVSLTDSGTYRAVLSASSGQSTNSVELVAVAVSDTFAPKILSAGKSVTSNTKVIVAFSEPLLASTANAAANYKINNGITVSAAALSANGKIVELTTTAIVAGSKLTVTGVADPFNNAMAATTVDIGVQKAVLLVTADPGPLTFAGDIAVQQRLVDRGFDVQLTSGADVPDDGSTATGKDLIIQTSSLGSGTVEVAGVGKFRFLPIPAMVWEASSEDAFAFQAANGAATASQTQLNILDPTSPLAAGLPKGLVTVVTTPEPFSHGTPTGAHVDATLAADASQAAIYHYEKGEKGEAGFVMPARRVFFYFGDNTAAVSNDNGLKLFDAAVDWLLGIQAVTPTNPTLALARTATGLTLTFTGTLQSADAITGPWADVAGATSPRTETFTGTGKFYRAKQ